MKIKKGYRLLRIVVGFIILMSFPFSFCQMRADPLPQAEPEGSPLISMDLQDADLKDVLKSFSQQAGLNFIASEKVKTRKVTLYLDKVTVLDALTNIMEANDLTYELAEDSDIFIVKESVRPRVETLTRVFTLKYATVRERRGEEGREGGGDVVEVVKGLLSPHGSLTVDGRTNSLIITDIPIKFGVIDATIAELDVPSPQVMMEVEVIETSLAALENLGIEWGGATGELLSITPAKSDLMFPYQKVYEHALGWRGGSGGITAGTLGTDRFAMILEMLTKDTETKILARPRILTLNNESAEIKITADSAVSIESITVDPLTGREIIKPERMETGITLKVTPTINEDNRIIMLIEPEVSRTRVSAIAADVYDPIKRTAKTTVMVDDGQTIIIGGLISTEDEETTRKVPFLGDIPILGYLFRKKDVDREDMELVIFITPHVVREGVSSTKTPSSAVKPMPVSPQPEAQEMPESRRKAEIMKAINEAMAQISSMEPDQPGAVEPEE